VPDGGTSQQSAAQKLFDYHHSNGMEWHYSFSPDAGYCAAMRNMPGLPQRYINTD
jgi:hypothetical protein